MVEIIIENNLEKMKSKQGEGTLGGFFRSICQLFCETNDEKIRADFYADSTTGEIKYFGYVQHIL